MPAAVSAARRVAAAAAYSRMRWRRSIRSRTASVSASRRRRSAGLLSEATGALQPLQARFDLLGGEGARVALDDPRHFAGLGGRDRAFGRGGDDGRDRRRHIGGSVERRQRKTRRAVPARADQASDDEPQYGAVAIHRLGERFPRDLAAGAIEQLLESWWPGFGCPAACLPDCPTDPSGICPRRSSEPEIAGCFQADNPPASDPAQGFGYWPEPRQRTKLLLPWETRSSNSDCVSPNLCCRGCVFKNKEGTYLVGAALQ